MERGMNLQIVDMKNDMLNVLNKYNFPIMVKQMVLNELMAQVNVLAVQEIEKEYKEWGEGEKDG